MHMVIVPFVCKLAQSIQCIKVNSPKVTRLQGSGEAVLLAHWKVSDVPSIHDLVVVVSQV